MFPLKSSAVSFMEMPKVTTKQATYIYIYMYTETCGDLPVVGPTVTYTATSILQKASVQVIPC